MFVFQCICYLASRKIIIYLINLSLFSEWFQLLSQLYLYLKDEDFLYFWLYKFICHRFYILVITSYYFPHPYICWCKCLFLHSTVPVAENDYKGLIYQRFYKMVPVIIIMQHKQTYWVLIQNIYGDGKGIRHLSPQKTQDILMYSVCFCFWGVCVCVLHNAFILLNLCISGQNL